MRRGGGGALQIVEKVAPSDMLQDKVNPALVLERKVQGHDKWMADLLQRDAFGDDAVRLDAARTATQSREGGVQWRTRAARTIPRLVIRLFSSSLSA